MPIILDLLATFGAWLLRGLVAYVPVLLLKLFATFGLAWVTHKFVAAPLLSLIQSNLNGVPAFALQCIGAMGGDSAITIILSAYAISAASRMSLGKATAPPAGGGG
jgi:peptidoglycan/LPS O-acetylase OafA/YrhL